MLDQSNLGPRVSPLSPGRDLVYSTGNLSDSGILFSDSGVEKELYIITQMIVFIQNILKPQYMHMY